jgi:uroporphyrin-III C-methyltransferase / precorrin-2 dehydrogenase / sirohydrochlorin ferrochelatase
MIERRPVTTPARIARLPNLPLFHKLEGRKAVVVGTSEGAVWKAELLAAAGAEVLRLDKWQPRDLQGAAVAVADLGDRDEALRFTAAAKDAGAVVNIIDQTDLCEVQFGTIVNRAPIVVAVSTDGAAPVLGQAIRARIESVLPLGLSDWARAAKEWRPRLRQLLPDFPTRRAFWKRFSEAAWRQTGRAPAEADFRALLADTPPRPRGSVTLVGAGPGDPELLTLKAVRVLQSATVILYDDLVAPDVLELARREARRVAVGKTGHGPSCSQAEINDRLVALARAGENVVRLKGGDPLIFGRATEEIQACRAAGIQVSIVPGISAAQGAAASLGFSLTERKKARRVQYLTGHGADGRLPGDVDWGGVADRNVTTVLYMPRRTLAEFARKAMAKGLDPLTPAVAIASATLEREAHVGATVTGIAAAAEVLPAGAPVTIIIGWVAREHAGAPAELLPLRKAS